MTLLQTIPAATESESASEPPAMTVCHLVQDVSFGGVETLLSDLIETTSPEVDHHVCYLSDHDEGAPMLADAGASVTKLEIPADSPRSCFDPRSYLPIVRYLRDEAVDVVHTHYPLYVHILGRLAGRAAGVDRVVGSYHNPRSDFHPMMQALEVATRPTADSTVGVSGEVESSFDMGLTDFAPFAHDGPVYNGIQVDAFRDDVDTAAGAAVRERHGIDPDSVVYLSVGRYDQQKRQVDLVSAMDHLDTTEEAHLLLVGHGPLQSTLESRVRDLDLEDSVTVTGRVESVEEYYAAGDVFVSASKYEGFGIVFVEAMAAGLPVVGTQVPGTSEVVEDGETGVLVPPNGPGALADVMADFQDESTRATYGSRGLDRARTEFAIETAAERYLARYRGGSNS